MKFKNLDQGSKWYRFIFLIVQVEMYAHMMYTLCWSSPAAVCGGGLSAQKMIKSDTSFPSFRYSQSSDKNQCRNAKFGRF